MCRAASTDFSSEANVSRGEKEQNEDKAENTEGSHFVLFLFVSGNFLLSLSGSHYSGKFTRHYQR